MILRCTLPRPSDGSRICDGLIGGAPDGAVVLGELERIEDARPDHYAMRCSGCKRFVEVAPALDRAA